MCFAKAVFGVAVHIKKFAADNVYQQHITTIMQEAIKKMQGQKKTNVPLSRARALK
jgi:hypothetical protein